MRSTHLNCLTLANSKKEDKSFSVSSSVIKAVIGKEYKRMLNVLTQMGYIKQGNGNYGSDKHFYYEIGAYSKMYLMKDVPIHCWYGTNAAVRKYKEKAAAIIAAYQENIVHTSFDNRYGSTFRKQCLISLNYFHLEDEERLGQFIKESGYDKDTALEYVYYRDILTKLENKKDIYSVDRNGRIYHVLCNLSKELKDYINIDFSLDCKNSHPLLLNSFIFKSHSISVNSSAIISKFLSGYVPVKELYPAPQQSHTPYIYHNVEKNHVKHWIVII